MGFGHRPPAASQYRQARLANARRDETVSWLPVEFAVLDRELELRDGDNWADWAVAEVFDTELSNEDALVRADDFKHLRPRGNGAGYCTSTGLFSAGIFS